MTTKVVKGSLWTLVGTVLPLMASLLSTPFVIRFLGTESYGVLILVGLIPNYFAFADFGMGIASTKFGAEAYGQGKRRREAEVVRTAASIALATSLVFAIPIFLFSSPIIAALEVPEYLRGEASVALKITAVSFVLGILVTILNTPQLARLRMDLNSAINAGTKLTLAVATPIVLYLGGHLVAAASVTLTVVALGLAAHIFVSGRLLRKLFGLTLDRRLVRPLLGFGTGILLSSLAGMLLANLEKLFLTKLVSVKSLAYYSVAFTFANMATMFSWAMVQALIPAFSQLLTPERRGEFDALFARSIRLSILWLLPTVMMLFVIARPFFSLWAGPDFGAESSLPFYILLLGLLCNIIAYVPYTAVTASGRTDLLAKVYWIELAPYIATVVLFINWFGIVGAALAWSLRVTLDALVFIWLARRTVGVSFHLKDHLPHFLIGAVTLVPPVLFAAFYDNYSLWLAALALASLAVYLLLSWKFSVLPEERNWIEAKIGALLGR